MNTTTHRLNFSQALTQVSLISEGPADLTNRQNRSDKSNHLVSPESEAEPVNLDEVVNSIVDGIGEIERRRIESIDEMRSLAIEIAMAATSKILMQEISDDRFPLKDIVDEMVLAVGESPTTIYLNPKDHQMFVAQLGDDKTKLENAQIELLLDKLVNRGGCRIKSERFEFLRDIQLQIDQIRQKVSEVMDDASIERRKTESAHSQLQRFPDRRSAS